MQKLIAKCRKFRGTAEQVRRHEIRCSACALKYAGRQP